MTSRYVFASSSLGDEDVSPPPPPSSLSLGPRLHTSKSRKRLPELDFCLAFAHTQATKALSGSTQDLPLRMILGTWLNDLKHRFKEFEKNAAQFDEFQSSLLQSQRKHIKQRAKVSELLREQRKLNKLFARLKDKRARTMQGNADAKNADKMLKLMSR